MNDDERIISCKLIDYLEKMYSFDFIAREVPFSSGERRADLVAADRKLGMTYAFEIKSENDTLIRLQGQLEAYRTTFNYVNVVTTPKYLSAVKEYGLWFGILLINEDGLITVERRPRKRLLSKQPFDRPQAKDHFTDYNASYVEWLCQRYEPLYELFVKERTTSTTTIDDIKILSLRSDRIAVL